MTVLQSFGGRSPALKSESSSLLGPKMSTAGSNGGDATLSVGETVRLLATIDDTWSIVAAEDGIEHHIPSLFLGPVVPSDSQPSSPPAQRALPPDTMLPSRIMCLGLLSAVPDIADSLTLLVVAAQFSTRSVLMISPTQGANSVLVQSKSTVTVTVPTRSVRGRRGHEGHGWIECIATEPSGLRIYLGTAEQYFLPPKPEAATNATMSPADPEVIHPPSHDDDLMKNAATLSTPMSGDTVSLDTRSYHQGGGRTVLWCLSRC